MGSEMGGSTKIIELKLYTNCFMNTDDFVSHTTRRERDFGKALPTSGML